MPFKCPTLGSIQVIKCPYPGDISQAHKWQKDGRNVKIFIDTANNSHSIKQKLRNTVSVFTTNKSLVQSGGNRYYKVTEGLPFLRVSCNIQSVLLIMTNSMTCIIAHLIIINIHAAGQSNWPLLSFLLLNWIAGIGTVMNYKHNLIHSYVQSLNPILKISKFKYLQIRHKPRNQLATKAQSFPRKSSNTASPIARHAKDFTWNRGCSSNSPPPGRLW